ncbi:MAG: DEAD/DEAH box helicase [Bacteroidia bacterium]|nr:DEAD/DEAH box helicase [Bacteroidia bacterium]
MNFNELNLHPVILKNLEREKYTQPTPIQERAIPLLLQKRDLFGCAQTGTGKTAAFALPILQHLNEHPAPGGPRPIRALILAPTRELASQIHESFVVYGKDLPVRHTVIFGGVGQNPQVDKIRKGVDVLIATPGRLLDLIGQGFIKLHKVEHFVLDEADRMLDMGFIKDIRRIVSLLPHRRNSLMFSATLPEEVKHLVKEILRTPEFISVTPVSSSASQIDQLVYHVEKDKKRELLQHLFRNMDIEHALVFTRTKRGADRVSKFLNREGIRAEAIHGDKSQSARERALKVFKDRKIRVLVATDIASRGIDVDQLSHVINFELPEQAETYVHRIGRTGRAGASGQAISLCSSEEKDLLKDIHKLIKKQLNVVSEHPFRK